MELWQRFTSRARRAVLLAHDEAKRAGAPQISGECLLLGLLRLGDGPTHDLLASHVSDLEALVAELRADLPHTEAPTSDDISFTPEAQRALARAYEQAKELRHGHVHTQHLLLGLMVEDEQAHVLLHARGVTLDLVREAVATLLPASEPRPHPAIPPVPASSSVPPVGHFEYVFHVPGRYVNDHCLIRHADLWHLFYIDGEVGKGCYDEGNETIIGHAVSPDLRQWEALAPALVYAPEVPWESRGIFAPYVFAHGGRFWMYYASHNLAGAQYLCLATSVDLHTWERHPANPVIVPSLQWAYWDESAPTSCRDAHVIAHDDHGFILYWVGDMKDRRDHSCIAASVSRDLVHWQEIGPVLIRSHSNLEALTCKTESPCLIRRGDRYFLFYRHGNGTKFAVSDDPLDFLGRDSYFLSTAHAAEVFEHEGEWYVTSCSRPPGDVAHTEDRRHGLWLGRLVWQDDWPVIV